MHDPTVTSLDLARQYALARSSTDVGIQQSAGNSSGCEQLQTRVQNPMPA